MPHNTLPQEKSSLAEKAAIPESEPGTFRYAVEQGQMSEQQMVEHLRSGLADKEATPEVIKDMSDVMHAMVKSGIKEAGASPEQTRAALDMLEASQPGSRIADVQITDTGYGAVYYTGSRNIIASFISSNSRLSDTGGVNFKHPADARLFATAQVIAHESGHARNNGMADYTNSKYPQSADTSFWSPTSRHLHTEPGHALTGNKNADEDTYEEQEAQGYAAIGVAHMMRVMGYDETDVQKYLDATNRYYRDPVTGKRGHNLLDVLSKVGPDKAPHQLVDPKTDLQHRTSGGLGYARPLSPENVVNYLAEAEQLAAEARPEPTAEEWYQEVKALHNGKPHDSLKEAIAARRKVVWSERGRFAKKASLAVGAVALSAYAFFALHQGLEDADVRQQHKPVPTHDQPSNSTTPKLGSIQPHK